MSAPEITSDDVELVNQVLKTPNLSIGPMLKRFEDDMARYVGTRHAIGVSSGTAGLHLCVVTAGVSEGDLVITSPFSFVASSNCILYERGVPVFVDIDEETGNIDPALVAEAAEDLTSSGSSAVRWLPHKIRDLSTESKLKAILPVHAFGQPADMDPIMKVSREHGLITIEDACDAVGAEYRGRKVGTFGESAVFAFYPNKQMTTGEGGMIVTGRDDWDPLFRSLRNQGRDIFDAWLNHSRLGYNYRLDELSAALGVAQLKRIEQLLLKREHVARLYGQHLADIDGVETPHISSDTTRMSWFVYVVRLAQEVDRDSVMARLGELGIPSRPYFTSIHLQPFYRERFGYQEGDLPVTERVAASSLALPFHSNLDEESIKYVCKGFADSIAKSRRRKAAQ